MEVVNIFKPLVIGRNITPNSWNICLYHIESEKRYWFNVVLDEYHDLIIDWNQTDFNLNFYNDIERKAFQEESDNLDEASEIIMLLLKDREEVFLCEDGDWYLQNETWTWKEPEFLSIN